MTLPIAALVAAFEKGEFTKFGDILQLALDEIADPNRGYDLGDLAYNGFEPRAFIKSLAKKYKSKGNEGKFLSHTIMICKLFTTRGTKWSKIKGKLNDKGTALMTELATASGLCDNTANATNVTIGRWACCFPSIVGHMMKDDHGGVSRIVCDENGFPSWVAIPGIMGLFHKEILGKTLTKAAALMYFAFSETLTQYIKDKVPGANPLRNTGAINQTILIIKASLGKGLTDAELSLDQLTKLGIVYYDDKDSVSAWGALGLNLYPSGGTHQQAVQAGSIKLAGFHQVEDAIDDICQRNNNLGVELKNYLDTIDAGDGVRDINYKDFEKKGAIWPGCENYINAQSNIGKIHNLMDPKYIVAERQ